MKEHVVQCTLWAVNPRKAAGPDDISGCVLKDCVASWLKSIPGTTSFLLHNFDPHQFAYRANRSTENAKAIALHAALSHLEGQGNYVRLLFVDYSFSFNTICPHKLADTLVKLGLPYSTCMWINSFLFR